MPRLRGHHLICLHFFSGRGYDDEFVGRLRELVERSSREGVEIVAGPDDVCAFCCHLGDEGCRYGGSSEAEVSAMDRAALELLQMEPGLTKEWEALRREVPALFAAWYRAYCSRCDWKGGCDENPWFAELAGKVL